MAKTKKSVDFALPVLVDYKRGDLTFEETVERFAFHTGITKDMAKEFVKKISKENIIDFKRRRKK